MIDVEGLSRLILNNKMVAGDICNTQLGDGCNMLQLSPTARYLMKLILLRFEFFLQKNATFEDEKN